jgi:ankyrin repeat protein
MPLNVDTFRWPSYSLVIKKNLDFNILNKDNATAVHCAARNGNTTILELLLQSGAKNNCNDKYGKFPLDYAWENGHYSSVKLLLDYGATNTCHIESDLVLNSLDGVNIAITQLLLDRGVVAAPDFLRWKLIALAALKDTVIISQLPGTLRAKINSNYEGQTLLHMATEENCILVVRLLLQNGAKIDTDNRGETPLHIAADSTSGDYAPIVKLLLDHARDTDVIVKNLYGDTALDLAFRQSEFNPEVIRLLRERLSSSFPANRE